MPVGLCQGFAIRSSPAGTLCALLILPSRCSASASAPGGAARSACHGNPPFPQPDRAPGQGGRALYSPAAWAGSPLRAGLWKPWIACARPLLRRRLAARPAALPEPGQPRHACGVARKGRYAPPDGRGASSRQRQVGAAASTAPLRFACINSCQRASRDHILARWVACGDPAARDCGIRPALACGFPAVIP